MVETMDEVTLTAGEHMLVVGPCASGKTMLLDRFAAEWDGDVVRIDHLAGQRQLLTLLFAEERPADAPRRLILVDHVRIGPATGAAVRAAMEDVPERTTVVYAVQEATADRLRRAFPRVVELERRR